MAICPCHRSVSVVLVLGIATIPRRIDCYSSTASPRTYVGHRLFMAMVKRHGAFLERAFAAVWEKEQSLADEATLITLANECEFDGAALLTAAKTDETKATYERYDREAIAADVFGSPSYVLDGEVFWGQDRLDFLEDALVSNRPAFRPDK